MSKHERLINADQAAIIHDIVAAYGTEPEDILFFTADPKPFFGFETSSVMVNRLAPPKAIDLEPIEPISPDSVSYRCQIYFPAGTNYSAVGVANRNEEIDGEKANDQQLAWLASSRALRSTLRIAGIDLYKLHLAEKNEAKQDLQFTGTRSNRSALIAQAHALGQEVGLIEGDDKTLWYKLLSNRFKTSSSNLLSEAELADWVAYLKTLTVKPTIRYAAA